MGSLPVLTPGEVIVLLEALGFREVHHKSLRCSEETFENEYILGEPASFVSRSIELREP